MYLHSVCILSSAGKVSTGTRAAQKRRPLCRCLRSGPAEIVCYGYFSRLARKLPHGQQTGPGCKSWIEGATLGLVPALNGSKSLGECSPGILIQHFVRHRGQTQVWTRL